MHRHTRELPGYGRVLDRVPAAVAYVDRFYRVRFANDRYCQLHGLSRPEIVGRGVQSLIGVHMTQRVAEGMSAALKGHAQRFERSLQFPDGRTAWAEVRYIPDCEPDGRVRGFVVHAMDIDGRVRAEESRTRLEHAVDRGMEGFGLHDAEGRFTYLNPAMAEMYGYEPEDLIGQSWKALYDAEQIEEIERVHFPELQREGTWKGELHGRKRDGSGFDVEVSLTLFQGAVGEEPSLLCNSRDVTERKLVDESLRQLHKMEAVGQLTGGVAHDFNNLLSVILGQLELSLEELPADHPATARVRQAAEAGERAATLTARLLAFSRKQRLNPRTIDVDELLARMDELLRRTLGEEIEVRLEAFGGGCRCCVDPCQLENALLNLALNARDAMPHGGRLTVRALGYHDEALAADFVRLEIEDNGAGIEESDLSRVFEPFFTTKDTGQGSGLGLSMVYGFARQSGGSLTVDSEVGRGTIFRLDLPRVEIEVEIAPMVAPAVLEGGQERILLVEDDANVRRMVAALLERMGYCVEAVEHGAPALELLTARADFDLLLTDAVLPYGMSGPELALQARRLNSELRVLLMSGYTEIEFTRHAGFTADAPLLQKPFPKSELSLRVRQALDSPRNTLLGGGC